MSQESTGIHWLLSDTNFILSSNIVKGNHWDYLYKDEIVWK